MTHHHHGNTTHSHFAVTETGHSDLGEHDCSQYGNSQKAYMVKRALRFADLCYDETCKREHEVDDLDAPIGPSGVLGLAHRRSE